VVKNWLRSLPRASVRTLASPTFNTGAPLRRDAVCHQRDGWMAGELAPATASNNSKYVFNERIVSFRICYSAACAQNAYLC
jgi:hypothetical protein